MFQYASKSKAQSEKSKTNTTVTHDSHVHADTKRLVQTKSLFSPSFNSANDSEILKSDNTSCPVQLTSMTYSPLQMQLIPKQEQREINPLPIKLNEKQKQLVPAPLKPNNTGIPLQMKEKFESLSGFSFDDVKVHYNSDKPTQLRALAYTQGNQVYVASGQEKHLGHELGHVVQQKQGIVRSTDNIYGMGINSDNHLEKGADYLAEKSTTSIINKENIGEIPAIENIGIIQRAIDYKLHHAIIRLRQNKSIFDEKMGKLKIKTDSFSQGKLEKNTKGFKNILRDLLNYLEDNLGTNLQQQITDLDISDLMKIIGFFDTRTAKEGNNNDDPPNIVAAKPDTLTMTNCFYRRMSQAEFDLVVDYHGKLIGNNTSLGKAVWIAKNIADTGVGHAKIIKFTANMNTFFTGKKFIDLMGEGLAVGAETAYPEYISYKSNERNCIGVGVFLLHELNNAIIRSEEVNATGQRIQDIN